MGSSHSEHPSCSRVTLFYVYLFCVSVVLCICWMFFIYCLTHSKHLWCCRSSSCTSSRVHSGVFCCAGSECSGSPSSTAQSRWKCTGQSTCGSFRFTVNFQLHIKIHCKITFLSPHRVLKVFLSRTAQRVPYMSSLHLLRILGVMLMTVSWFLCAWTVGVLQNRDRNIPVFFTSTTSHGQGFNLCYMDRWDYMMAVGESQRAEECCAVNG